MTNRNSAVILIISLFLISTINIIYAQTYLDPNDDDIEDIRHLFLLNSSSIRKNDYQEGCIKELASYGKKAADFLVAQLNTNDPARRLVIRTTLVTIGEDAVDLIIERMAIDRGNRGFCISILGEIGDPKATIPILLLLDSDDAPVRAEAAQTLGNFNQKIVIKPLIEALEDSISAVRQGAAYSLGKLKEPATIEHLIKLLRDSNHLVRHAASYALAQIAAPEIGVILLDKLNNAQDIEKFVIMETLGRLKYEPALDKLIESLDDPSHYTRGFACEALGFFRGKYQIANALKEALHDNSPFVRMKAKNALERNKG